MSHLGPELHDLVDGRLAPPAAELVLMHVARCPDCAAELAALRRACQALAADIPAAPADLTARLLALGTCPPTPRATGSLSVPLPGSRPAVSLDGIGPGSRRTWWAAVPVAAAAVVIGLVALGEPRTVVPTDHPALALTALGGSHAAVAGTPDLATEALGSPLPEGFDVVEANEGPDGRIDVLVATPAGARIVVESAVGRLADGLSDDHPVTDLGGRPVVVLSQEPFHAVWQCGDRVMGVVAPDAASVADLVAALPGEDFDGGTVARVVRGWNVVAGAWSP